MLKAWKKILTGIQTAKIIADCGVDIGKGSYLIYQNSLWDC